MPKIRRLLCCILIISQLFAITTFAEPPAWPSDTGIMAESGAVIDVDSGTLIYGQNCINNAYPPASITKLLTALIVLENCELDEVVTFSDTAMLSVEADSGNKLSLVAGDQLSVEDCLYALLLFSVNQSANALAEHTAGSIPAFVDMMNAKAAQLGCSEKTHFDNPSGLNGDTQKVTAYDMALIAKAAFNNEELLKISSSLNHKIAPTVNNPTGVSFRHEHRLIYTTDPSSEYYYPPAVAGKTGYLRLAGNTLVTYAEKDGRRLISIILKGSYGQYFVDGKNLLEFGFSRFKNLVIAEHESHYVTGEEPVLINDVSYHASDLMIEPERVITLPNNANFEDAMLTLEGLPSDHPENAVALLRYSYNDRQIGKAFLLLKDSAKRPGELTPDSESPSGSEENLSDASVPDQSEDDGFSFHMPSLPVLAIGVAAGFALLAVLSAIWVFYSKRKEARDLAARREARRRRLQASGEEAEFQRLMEIRRNKDAIAKQKRNDSSKED